MLEVNWNRESFPEDSLSALNNFNSSLGLEEFEAQISKWMLEVNKLPEQLNMYNTFGEPPVTLFNNGKFAVDIYFWRKNDTIIHSHAFRGAFKVLYGQSLHEEFQVKITDEIEKDIVCSEIVNSKTTIMNASDNQIIKPGMELVHRVLHLDNPTITLCLRTVEDTELSQWHHLTSGLSFTKYNLDPLTIKRVLYFQYLYNSNPVNANEFLNNTLKQMDASAKLSLYESLFTNEFGLDYEVSNIIIESMHAHCENTKWFKLHDAHYSSLQNHLIEYKAPTAELKLLAHSINSNYTPQKVEQLLSSVSKTSLKDLLNQLLKEEAIFDEQYFEQQMKQINKFSQIIN